MIYMFEHVEDIFVGDIWFGIYQASTKFLRDLLRKSYQ